MQDNPTFLFVWHDIKSGRFKHGLFSFTHRNNFQEDAERLEAFKKYKLNRGEEVDPIAIIYADSVDSKSVKVYDCDHHKLLLYAMVEEING